MLNGEFYEVRSELVNLFDNKMMLSRLSQSESTQPTSSNSPNNLDSNRTSTSSPSVQLNVDSYYINETLETIETCSKQSRPADRVSDSNSKEFIDAVNYIRLIYKLD